MSRFLCCLNVAFYEPNPLDATDPVQSKKCLKHRVDSYRPSKHRSPSLDNNSRYAPADEVAMYNRIYPTATGSDWRLCYGKTREANETHAVCARPEVNSARDNVSSAIYRSELCRE